MNITKERVAACIKVLREQNGLKQHEIADLIGMHKSNYSKIESGQREISVDALHTIASHFNISLDDLLEANNKVPQQPDSKNLSLLKQLELIQTLDEEDKNMIFKMIDTFISKKHFKDFLERNMDTL